MYYWYSKEYHMYEHTALFKLPIAKPLNLIHNSFLENYLLIAYLNFPHSYEIYGDVYQNVFLY